MNLTETPAPRNARGLESKPSPLDLAGGFFLFPQGSRAVSQLFEPCPSCGRRLRLTTGTITVRGVCGHVATCEVCRGGVVDRGLIG